LKFLTHHIFLIKNLIKNLKYSLGFSTIKTLSTQYLGGISTANFTVKFIRNHINTTKHVTIIVLIKIKMIIRPMGPGR